MQLKHLFVFLLVLILSVVESPVYSLNSSSDYYQSSKIVKRKNLNFKNTKYIVFNRKNSLEYFLTFFLSCIHLKNAYQEQIQISLKLQKQLYQKIALLNKQNIFLIHKIITSNSTSTLYRA
jgi:cell division protein FtsB